MSRPLDYQLFSPTDVSHYVRQSNLQALESVCNNSSGLLVILHVFQDSIS